MAQGTGGPGLGLLPVAGRFGREFQRKVFVWGGWVVMVVSWWFHGDFGGSK